MSRSATNANPLLRGRARLDSPPPAGNALELVVENFLVSDNALVNATDSAASSIPSQSASAVLSKPVASAAEPSASVIPGSFTPSATSTPAEGTSATSSSDRVFTTVPKNVAASSALSSVASAADTGSAKSQVPKSSEQSPSTSSASSSSAPSRPDNNTPAQPSPTPSTSSKAATTSVAATTPASVSTQHVQTTPSDSPSLTGTTNQAPVPTTSGTTEQKPTTTAAGSPQPSGSSSSGVVRQDSPSNGDTGGTQTTASDSTGTNLGNSLIGVGSSATSVHVDSTLSSAKAVTITSGSSTFTTTPAFITSISVESGKNGSPPQTFTSVFANPTSIPSVSTLNDSTFFDNKGAVAGVFTVVALAILAFAGGIVWCCRRRRQRFARGSLANAQFRRFSGPPEMSQQPTTYQAVGGRSLPPGLYGDDPQRYLMAPSLRSGPSAGHDGSITMQRASSQNSHSGDSHRGALGLTGIARKPPGNAETYNGPFSDYYRYNPTGEARLNTPPGEGVGIAVTSDFAEAKPVRESSEPASAPERRSPSPAPSSPSIYPPSLPAVPEKDEDDYKIYERETRRSPESQFPSLPPRAVVNDGDPRNPFSSPLDTAADAATKQPVPPIRIQTNQAYRPLTPPDSSAGHSPTTPQFSAAEDSTKSLNVVNVTANRFSNTFLGRSVSTRTEPLPRPKRNPLRLSATSATIQRSEES